MRACVRPNRLSNGWLTAICQDIPLRKYPDFRPRRQPTFRPSHPHFPTFPLATCMRTSTGVWWERNTTRRDPRVTSTCRRDLLVRSATHFAD
ncbi:hypothetical protein THTE_0184 [Thermogutta terrifontis]|uniref:Uncharacterized protein n=1 Tax=Thermogutta terrifontis TaxID=1331910 RepID=A0A286RA01_9BACT|nr:hypothetical protein THTE_0184 [Thermogutta terrifontis]